MNADHGREQPERILVVEDEQIVALDIRLHLEQFGYTVAACHAEAETALKYLEDSKNDRLPDLVIMDIHLQGEMDGVEASEIIHRDYDLPVIFMTAYADEETLSRAKVTEPFAYIIKPFEERELRTAVVLAMYRHRMSQALRDREQLLSQVMEAMHSGIVLTGPNCSIRYANTQAERIAGFDLASGTPMGSVLPEAVLREFDCTTSGAASDGRCVNWDRTGMDGTQETIEIRTHRPADGSPATVWVLTDITERLNRERALREQEEQLAYSRRMEAVGRMSAGLAHDFNNLVTVILGYARLVLDDATDHPELAELRENVHGLYDTAHRSAELTRRLLTFSRIPTTKQETISLENLVNDVLPMVQGVLPENVRLQTTNHAARANVTVDRRAMQQVLLNLVLNARDAMPQGGIVYLTAEAVRLDQPLGAQNRTLDPGHYVLISVADTGEGIEPEDLPHVFEPFFTTKDEAQGSGFGLATVYSVVADADGAIQVSSTRGHGSRFSIYLPLSEESVPGEHSTRESEPELNGTGTILVVDEETGVRSLLVETLRAAGYSPVSARSVGEALLLLDHFADCSTVATDLSAPYHTTSEIVALYRDARPGIQVVLLLSGEPVEAGQDATLLKPFVPEQFLRTIHDVRQTG